MPLCNYLYVNRVRSIILSHPGLTIFTKSGTHIKHIQTMCREKELYLRLYHSRNYAPLYFCLYENGVRTITLKPFKIFSQNLVQI